MVPQRGCCFPFEEVGGTGVDAAGAVGHSRNHILKVCLLCELGDRIAS